MAVFNILDVPGLTYTLRYIDSNDIEIPTPTVTASVIDGEFVVATRPDDGTWQVLIVEITNFGVLTQPVVMYLTLTFDNDSYSNAVYTALTPVGPLSAVCTSDFSAGPTGTINTACFMADSLRFVGAGPSGAIPNNTMSLLLEVEGGDDPRFWTDNVNCTEYLPS